MTQVEPGARIQGYPQDAPREKELLRFDLPVAGMSCAVFHLPKSRTVRINGGSTVPGWEEDNYPDDIHYSFRVIRVTVVDQDGKAGDGP
jgi:hypothetical protein